MQLAASEKLVATKAEVSAWLARADVPRYGLAAVDPRLEAYVREVAANPRGHNLWEQLAVRRFLGLVDKYGLRANEVRRFYTLYEHLHFPGTRGLRCYALTPVQCFQFASIYGFYEGAHRVVREAVLYVPRKFSKTTSTAAIAVDDLLYGDANAETYTGANSADQAKKCFDVIRGCMRKLDPHGRRYVVNEQMIKSLRSDRQAFAQCLTANARTKDGLNASTVIMDEFSQARDSDLLTVLTTSMGVRENPLTVIITTASDVFDGPFYSMLQGYKGLLLGDYEDDSVFAHLFEPDVGDDEGAESTWLKVHPHIGVTVSLDFYRREYQSAVRNGSEALLAFRTKLLNVYAENERRAWISSTLARSISRPMSIETIAGRPEAMVAIDLSVSGDFSAVSFGVYSKATKSFFFHTAYFFPEGGLTNHPNEKLYRAWAAAGHLHLTRGDTIDYREIVDYVLYLNKRIRILRVGYDPYKSHEMINMLAASITEQGGSPDSVLKAVSQTYGNFTAPTESFEHGAKTGHVFIDDNPINFYCFGNAVLDFDKLENCKPIKRHETQRIDGVITKLMCMRLFIDHRR